MTHNFRISEQRVVQTSFVGIEQAPVIVIDGLLSNPEALVDFAASTAKFVVPKNWYPGLRADPVPQDYVIELIRVLHPIIGATFDLPTKGGVDTNTYFGLATLPPKALSTLQRLPHFDTANPRQIALLHYLCTEQHGGTSFFRHRSTGYESIDARRERAYFECVEKELALSGPRLARYVSGDDDLYEETARFDAKFNRMIVYRSQALHSANVNADMGLASDPRGGRLTANVFLAYR